MTSAVTGRFGLFHAVTVLRTPASLADCIDADRCPRPVRSCACPDTHELASFTNCNEDDEVN